MHFLFLAVSWLNDANNAHWYLCKEYIKIFLLLLDAFRLLIYRFSLDWFSQMWTCLSGCVGRQRWKEQTKSLYPGGHWSLLFFTLPHVWGSMSGMRHQRPPVSRCSSLCYLYKESRDRFSYTSLPSAPCGHMGWGYRMQCMLVGEKRLFYLIFEDCIYFLL